MKILLTTEPGVDGVFRYVEALAHFIINHGAEVHLAYSDRRGSEALGKLVAYVEAHGGETLNLDVGNKPGLADARALTKLAALAHRVKPDVIHSHSSKAGVLARLLPLLGVSAPQVYHPHAYPGMRPQSPAARLLYDGIETVLGHTSLTINCSGDEQRYARRRLRLPANRTLCLPNSVDTETFSPPTPQQKATLRRAFGLPADAVILGSLGRASKQKDPLTLYRAFARARQSDPKLVLFHLGRGELDAELDDFIRTYHLQSHLIRRDYLSTPVDFYRAVDGFILTSLYEGLSLGALEAMACDLPLILSDAPGNQELLQLPLSHLWYASIGDAEGFARAMHEWAARCRLDRATTPSNHRAIAREQFDSRTNLLRMLEVYRLLATRVPFKSLVTLPGNILSRGTATA